ncbi:hypothetical protein Tco_0715867 [Tanacetum coccineum]
MFMRKVRSGLQFLEYLLRWNIDAWPVLLVTNPVFHEKTKHFEIDVHVIREKVQAGIMKTEKVVFADQTSDMLSLLFSKPLDPDQSDIHPTGPKEGEHLVDAMAKAHLFAKRSGSHISIRELGRWV